MAYDPEYFKCYVCGAAAHLADPDPVKTVCTKHCPDHDYEWDTAAEAFLCVICGDDAPTDYMQETGLECGSGEPC